MTESKKYTKTRTGCWTCRQRGYRCDEGKPACNNCRRLNIICEGYGIRVKFKEIHTTYPRAISEANYEISKSDVLETVLNSVDLNSVEQKEKDKKKEKQTLSIETASTSRVSQGIPGTFIDTDIHLEEQNKDVFKSYSAHLEYFANHVAPCICASKGGQKLSVVLNELIETSDNALLDSICSLATRHYQNANKIEDDEIVTKYKVSALQKLRKAIQSGPMDLLSLATILILAIVEVFECNLDAWNSHLGGAIRGLISLRSQDNLSCDGNNSDLLSYYNSNTKIMTLVDSLCYHDLMSSLCSDKISALSPIYRDLWKPLQGIGIMNQALRPRSNSFYFMTQELFFYLSEITILAADVINKSSGPFDILELPKSEDFFWKKETLKAYLIQWNPPSLPQNLEQNLNARLFRVATLLYLHLRLEFIIDFQAISALMQEGLTLLDQISTEHEAIVTHAWPLWQLGVFCQSEKEKTFIATRARLVLEKLSKPSVAMIIKFLHDLWSLPSGDKFRESLTNVYKKDSIILF